MKRRIDKIKDFIKDAFKRLFKGFKIVLPWVLIVLGWIVFVFVHLAVLFVPYWIVILPIIYLIVFLINKLRIFRFYKDIKANTIVYGGRGSGKGLLFQKAISSEKKAFSNIPYGDNVEVISPKVYFGSITPNTAQDFLEDKVVVIEKNNEWEQVPYYADDSTIFFPNYLDSILKKNYPNISLFLPIQRHLLNSYSVFNAQDINRIYIHVRELQLDGYLKALNTRGTGFVWNRLPILRKYMRVRYRFYENVEAAVGGLLPFEKLGLVSGAASHIYLTAGEATKEQYEAKNGKIKENIVWINKKIIKYDTRYYHEVFYGYKAPLNPHVKQYIKGTKKQLLKKVFLRRK